MFKSREELLVAIKNSNLAPLDTETGYNDMLDDVYGLVNIAGLDYSASHALGMTDPIAHRCGHSDYCSAQVSDGLWVDAGDGFYCIHDVAEHFEMEVEEVEELI